MLEKVFIAIALFFTLSAAIGVWRLPDFYTRMHAASKVSSFGVGFLLVAVRIYFLGGLGRFNEEHSDFCVYRHHQPH
ncbi:MAG: monovalent cation/H(+) antiporter subunit G [Bdellovibrionaceae bacterium]|nr:monovalent cation/H(+) antiporter subunit G [Pseudobdellovibrionaceae bacterium]